MFISVWKVQNPILYPQTYLSSGHQKTLCLPLEDRGDSRPVLQRSGQLADLHEPLVVYRPAMQKMALTEKNLAQVTSAPRFTLDGP